MQPPDPVHAYQVLIGICFLPAIGLMAGGAFYWYTGVLRKQADTTRAGKMALMFGAIFAVILIILQYFLVTGPRTWTDQ